jgi:PAS domain S-box-containing protein
MRVLTRQHAPAHTAVLVALCGRARCARTLLADGDAHDRWGIPMTDSDAVNAHADGGATSSSGGAGDDWTRQITTVAIVHLDLEGRVSQWNPGAERLKGYSAEEIIGSSFTRFYRSEDQERGLPAALLAIAAARGSVEDNGWRVRANGELFWAHVVITALRSDDGSLCGYVKIVTDLTASKRREDADLAFVRAFAHDFRSPITALRGYVDMLADPSLGTGRALERLSTVTDHLATMMEDLTARIEAAGDGSPSTVVDVVSIVREAAEIVLPGDAYGRLRYHGVPCQAVWAEPVALRRAIVNLIDNAAKYSEGVIDISVRASGGDTLVVITDRGRGIAAEDVAAIFEPLERGRLSDPDDGGTGIGLASARALLEQHSGSIRIESSVGVGTSVIVTLATAEGLRATPERDPERDAAAEGAARRDAGGADAPTQLRARALRVA